MWLASCSYLQILLFVLVLAAVLPRAASIIYIFWGFQKDPAVKWLTAVVSEADFAFQFALKRWQHGWKQSYLPAVTLPWRLLYVLPIQLRGERCCTRPLHSDRVRSRLVTMSFLSKICSGTCFVKNWRENLWYLMFGEDELYFVCVSHPCEKVR